MSVFSPIIERVKSRFAPAATPAQFPFVPTHVQIQTVSGCNANCVFCPNQKTELEIPTGRVMDMDLFKSIVDQLVAMGVKRISPYLMNESMMDPKLPERVAYITSKKKKSYPYTKINTHGGLLTERMAKGLLEARLDKLNFSVQGLDPEIYERIMSLPLAKTIKNIERFLEMKRAGRYKTRVRIVMLDTVDVHPQLPKIKAFWAERGVNINVNQLENRGNHKAIQSDAIAVNALQPYSWCERLFKQAYILFDGRMVQCCADWEQKGVMGDLTKDSLEAIWNGPVYQQYRKRFRAGNLKGTICDGCTKDAVGGDGEDD